jgi:glucose-6-phosphate isomerase
MSDWNLFLGDYAKRFEECLEQLAHDAVTERLWQKDHTLWKDKPHEITNRLDWLEAPCRMRGMTETLKKLARDVKKEGFTKAVLLGMGGSSLAPLLFSRVSWQDEKLLDLEILDSTDPSEIRSCTARNNPKDTLYIVSTKSGTTLETLTLFRYFFALLKEQGEENPGRHFVAITDPQTPLVEMARTHSFFRILCNNPNIGGRYSMFSSFGLFPAVLCGFPVTPLIEGALKGMEECFPDRRIKDNKGALLGAFLGSLALSGCDKVVFLCTSRELEAFGAWLEQLLAESTGKENQGILPVVEREWTVFPHQDVGYAILTKTQNENVFAFLQNLQRAGRPYVVLPLESPYALGEWSFLCEFATAIAGYFLRINPFDQPDVESTKRFTRQMIAAPQKVLTGHWRKEGEVTFLFGGGLSLKGALAEFLSHLREDGYLAIQVFSSYVPELEEVLVSLSSTFKRKYRTVVTTGYGPRYLHSTGQLHKGDKGRGSFLQIVTQNDGDILIPGEAQEPGASLTFGLLKMVQALADRQALREKGRNVLTLIVPEKKARQLILELQNAL